MNRRWVLDWRWPHGAEGRVSYGTRRLRLHRLLLSAANESASNATPLSFFDIRPYVYKQEILEKLAAERSLHNCWRNLVVAATGTGKTVIAALDYARQAGPASPLLGGPTDNFIASGQTPTSTSGLWRWITSSPKSKATPAMSTTCRRSASPTPTRQARATAW